MRPNFTLGDAPCGFSCGQSAKSSARIVIGDLGVFTDFGAGEIPSEDILVLGSPPSSQRDIGTVVLVQSLDPASETSLLRGKAVSIVQDTIRRIT